MKKLLTIVLTFTLAMVALGTLLEASAQTQTITICKKTIPPGGTGFPFDWANSFGSQGSFPLNDGQCNTVNVTNMDKFNKFKENVPVGWTLTNIACTYTTSVVNIIGANSNPGFQPGDNTVTIALTEANVTCTFVDSKVHKWCDLAIKKTISPTPLVSGQPATVTIRVTNVGKAPCQKFITMTDQLPTGLKVLSVAQGGSLWNCSVTGANPPATVTCAWNASIQAVPPGPMPPITITANVTAKPGSKVTNCATVSDPSEDTNPANDKSCVTVPVKP